MGKRKLVVSIKEFGMVDEKLSERKGKKEPAA